MPSSTTVLIPLARLGKDPEFRMVGSEGKPKCDLWVAVDHWGAGNKRTEWYGISAWGHLAEIVAEHVTKGCEISVTGHLRSSQYEAKDGTKRRSLEIVADQVRFVSRPRAAASSEATEAPAPQAKRAA